MKYIIFLCMASFIFSCSHSKLQEKNELKNILQNNSIKLGESSEQIGGPSGASKVAPILPEYGPTNKENTIFKDRTDEYGLKNVQATNIYTVDFDRDGWTDLVILPEYYSRPVFYHFNSQFKKFEKLDYEPIDSLPKASFLVFADFDSDGIMDLLLSTLYQKTELRQQAMRVFKGEIDSSKKVHYKELTNTFPEKLWGPASVSLFDFDLDGKLDIYSGNWYDFTVNPIIPVPDHLLKGNNFDFKTDVSGSLKNEFKKSKSLTTFPNARPTFGTSVCDIDQNGYPDILTVSSGGYTNKLWINSFDKNGNQLFEDFATESGYASDPEGKNDLLGGGNGFYSICADYNNDGIMDIAYGAQVHSYDLETKDHSALLTGETREFPPRYIRTPYDVNFSEGEWTQSDRRGIWVDYNNDGLLDLLVENSGFPPHTRMLLFEQAKNHSFDDVAKKVGVDIMNPAGSAILDLNRDGKMDLIVGQNNMRDARIKPRIFVFENQLPNNEDKSLRVYFQGRNANKGALGALALLKTSKSVQRQMVQYSYGGLSSQNEAGIHFGLGKELPVLLSLYWPTLVKDELGRESPLLREYRLAQKLNKKGPWEITVCENGKWFNGRDANCL